MDPQPGSVSFRNIGIALVGIWLAIVLYSLLYQLAGVLTIHDFRPRLWAQIRGITFYMWTPWILLAPLVNLLALRFPLRPDGGIRLVLQHLVFMSLLALLHAFVASLTYYAIGDFDPGMENYEAWQHTGHYLFMDDMYLMDCFVYSVLMASVSLKRFFELARQRELDAERSQTQLVESQLQTLKMQVNPHFLFNTLNSIAVMIRKQDNAGAAHMVDQLSEFFRLTLEQGAEQLVTVEEELALIRQYLAIEQIRFRDRLSVTIDVDEACRGDRVPVLILQPLVENAIKHGLGKKPGPCELVIRVQRTADGLGLEVIDDGAGMARTRPGNRGIGLANIQARLAALYADRARFSFDSAPGKGARVNILIPAAT